MSFLIMLSLFFLGWAVWIMMGLFMGLLGFTRDTQGKVQFSLAAILAHAVVLGGAWELWSWASDKWGGAFVLGVIFGTFLFFVWPLQILFKSVR